MQKDKLHILYVSHEYFDAELPEAGGIGHFLASLGQGLVEKGHKVTVMGYSTIDLNKEVNGVRLIYFRSSISKIQSLYNFIERLLHFIGLSAWLIPFMSGDRKKLASRVNEFLEKEQVDVIELNDYLGDGAYLEVDKPVLIRAHGSYAMLHHEAGFRKNKAFVYFERMQAKKYLKGIGVSDYSSSMLKKHLEIQHVKTIYNGLDLKKYPYSTIGDFKRLFYFGTLSHAKGLDRLVKTFNILNKSNPEIELFIAGKPKEYFQDEILPGFTSEAVEKVHFLGYLNKEELVKEICKSGLIYFPSRVENFSLALLETMACVRTAVCWDISSFREIINHGQNGYLVNSVEEAAEDILKLLENKSELQRISENARITIEDHFTWDKISQENINHYKACIADYERVKS